MTRSQTFIANNIRKLHNGYDFQNVDTSLMPRERYDSAKVRVLLCVPGQASDKVLSATFAAINDYFITYCPDAFLDVAYLPEKSDFKLYDEADMPYAIGQITHLDASHFDIVGVSISVLHEILSAPVMVHSFERCDKPIPTFWSDRRDMKVGEVPVVYAGGISVFCADSCFGSVPDKGTSYFDFAYLGNCDRTDVLIDKYIEAKEKGLTIQAYVESCFELECVYQPQAYEVKYDDNLLITSNVKVNPKARDFVKPCYPHQMPDNLGLGRRIINASGAHTGNTETMISEGCSAAGACSFCSEGNYTGGWCEHAHDKIIKDCWESKKYSAGYTYKPFSFNGNYISDWKGLLGKLSQIFPSVTFLNMRMEEMGRDLDAMKIQKASGSNKFTAPIEGISPRIQNNFLNKCLSEESLRAFMDEALRTRVTEIKVGSILTGYEEWEDYKWFYDFVMGMRQKATDAGAKFPVKLKATPLVHYPLTPMEYLERKTARTSYEGGLWLMQEWYDTFVNDNISFIINGFKYSTFVEQALLDCGRALTPLIWKHFVEPLAPLYSLRMCCTESFVNALRSMVKNPDAFFGDRDIESYISPCHRIHIDLMGSYMPRARRLLRHKRHGSVFDNEPDIRCLKTYEGAKTKCYRACIVNDPITVYGDVYKDSNALRGQVVDKMVGCNRCNSNEERKARLCRPTPQTLSYEDYKALPKIPNILKTRFILSRNKAYDLLNPSNTAHTFLAKMLQASNTLLHSYNKVQFHSGYWQSEYQFPYTYSGTQIVDVLWREDVFDEIQRVVPLVNQELKSVKVAKVSQIPTDDKIEGSDWNLYTFESSVDGAIFDDASFKYKGEVFKIGGRMGALEPAVDSSLMKPLYFKKGAKVIGAFILPARYNPVLWLSAFLSTSKKVSDAKVVEATQFDCLGTYRESSSVVDKLNPQENGCMSVASGKVIALGRTNLCKSALSMLMKR